MRKVRPRWWQKFARTNLDSPKNSIRRCLWSDRRSHCKSTASYWPPCAILATNAYYAWRSAVHIGFWQNPSFYRCQRSHFKSWVRVRFCSWQDEACGMKFDSWLVYFERGVSRKTNSSIVTARFLWNLVELCRFCQMQIGGNTCCVRMKMVECQKAKVAANNDNLTWCLTWSANIAELGFRYITWVCPQPEIETKKKRIPCETMGSCFSKIDDPLGLVSALLVDEQLYSKEFLAKSWVPLHQPAFCVQRLLCNCFCPARRNYSRKSNQKIGWKEVG